MEFLGLSPQRIGVIAKREFKNYFNTPIGYIFGIIFLLFTGLLFFFIFVKFWEQAQVDMTDYFRMAVIMFCIFVPAVSMRLWAEESRSGTVETLLTLPFTDMEIILGKWLGATGFLGVILACSITVPITMFFFGSPDIMMIIIGYFVTMVVGASYIALGLLISSLFKDQITAFIVALVSCLILTFSGFEGFTASLGDFLGTFASYFSIYGHFSRFRAGFLELSSIVYLFSVLGIFLYLNKVVLENRRQTVGDAGAWGISLTGGVASIVLLFYVLYSNDVFKNMLSRTIVALTVIAILLYAVSVTWFFFRKHRLGFRAINAVTGIGAVILFNLFLLEVPIRYDITGKYNITGATKELVEKLPEPVVIDAFLSKEVPPYLISKFYETRVYLDELAAVAPDNIKLNFYDPADSDDLQKLASDYGIKAEQKGQTATGQKADIYLVYQSLVIRYGDEHIVFGQIAEAQNRNLENEFYKAVNRFVNPDGLGVAVAQASGTLNADAPQSLRTLQGESLFDDLLNSMHLTINSIEVEFGKVRRVNLETDVIDSSIQVLILPGPGKLSELEKYKLDQYILSGGQVIYLAQPMDVQMQGGQGGLAFPARASKREGIAETNKFFAHFGVRVQAEVIKDERHNQAQSRLSSPAMNYPFLNVAALENGGLLEHPWIEGREVFLSFLPSPIRKGNKADGIEVKFLAKTSDAAENAETPYGTILHPAQLAQLAQQGMPPQMMGKGKGKVKGPFNLMALVEPKADGKFKSFFSKDKLPEGAAKAAHLTESKEAGQGRIFVVGGAYAFSDYMTIVSWINPMIRPFIADEQRNIQWVEGQYLGKFNNPFLRDIIGNMLGTDQGKALRDEQPVLTTMRQPSATEKQWYNLVNMLLMPFVLGGLGAARFYGRRKEQQEYEQSLKK